MYSAPQRPITPPSDRKNSIKENKLPDREPIQLFNEDKMPDIAPTHIQSGNKLPDREPIHVRDEPVRIKNESKIPYIESHTEDHTTALKDMPFLNNDAPQPMHKEANPFVPSSEVVRDPFKDIQDTGITGSKKDNTFGHDSLKDTGREAFNDATTLGRDSQKDTSFDHNPVRETSRNQGTRQFQSTSGQRNETTRRIEREALSILQWENPIRSGLIFGLSVGSIILSRWYSLLQIASSLLCITTGINLFYVNFILQSQKIVTNHDVAHPYSDVIHNERRNMVDRSSVTRYANLLSDLAETVVRALTRIIFVEDSKTSIKWMLIFFAVWKISAHISTMNIVLLGIISAFIFPRLYISNKDIVDAHIHKGQNMIQMGINKASTAASEAVNHSYTKSRFMVAKVGTTGTDAKNTLQKTSATLKED